MIKNIAIIGLTAALIFMSFFCFTQQQIISLLEGKVKNDSISIQSYKGFINPNQQQWQQPRKNNEMKLD